MTAEQRVDLSSDDVRDVPELHALVVAMNDQDRREDVHRILVSIEDRYIAALERSAELVQRLGKALQERSAEVADVAAVAKVAKLQGHREGVREGRALAAAEAPPPPKPTGSVLRVVKKDADGLALELVEERDGETTLR